MSTLKADLLQNRLGTNSPSVTKGAFIRSYCSFIHTGGVPTFGAQIFNMSSLTDFGVGYININTTTPSTNSAFSAVAGGWANAAWTSRTVGVKTMSAARYDIYNVENAAAIDSTTSYIYAWSCGDLA